MVKFYRPQRWNIQQIAEEHQFALELKADDVLLAAPISFGQRTVLEHQGFYFAVFPSLGGRQYEADNIDQMEWVGRYLGRIHQTSRRHRFQHRPDMGVKEYLIEPRYVLENTVLLPSGLKDEFLKTTDALIDAVIEQWHDECHFIRLHGDCHPGNILWRDDPLFVDFDDARNGPAVQDLWMLLNGDKLEQRMQLDIILEAYEEFSSFNTDELTLIEPLRAMRLVHYLAWIVRRWDDPAFPRNFPWLTGEDYWRRQMAIFAEKIEALREPPLQLTPMY